MACKIHNVAELYSQLMIPSVVCSESHDPSLNNHLLSAYHIRHSAAVCFPSIDYWLPSLLVFSLDHFLNGL